jgi:peptide/nickel transport system ATP-binding protein
VAITHDLELAQALGGDVMVLRDGQVIEQGPAREVLERPHHPFTRQLLAADPARWEAWPQRAGTELVVHAQGLAKSRGGRLLFEDVELTVRRGDRLVLQGPSGTGKTTLGNILCGVLAPDRGSVAPAAGLPRTARQKLYQDPALAFPPQVPLETALRDVAALHGCPWLAMQDRLERLKVGGAMLRRRASQVSGGELQRIALARALAARPALLVADEPTSRLDPITQRQALQELMQAADDTDAALVLVTHDEGIARALGTQTLRFG